MAENEMDSDLQAGTPSTPSGGSSGETGGSGVQIDAKTLQASFEALTRRVEEIDKSYKTFQQGKDRGVNEAKSVRDEVSELKRKLTEIENLRKSGLDEDAAIEELTFRDEVRSVKDQLSKLNPAQPQPAGNSEGLVVDAAQVVKELGLDGTDPEVIEKIFRKEFKTKLEIENAALRIAYQRAKPNQPSPAAAPALTGFPPSPANAQNLLAEYEKESEKIPRGSAYIYKRSELKAKYRDLARKQGYNINI